jgi:hypothetical protein
LLKSAFFVFILILIGCKIKLKKEVEDRGLAMRKKVNTGYFLDDPRKFASKEEAEKELNRLRALCVRLKKSQTEEIHFLLGLSETDSQYIGYMGYDKPKNQGGKKHFICLDKIWKKDAETGETLKLQPCTEVPPHLHIMVEGYGASTCAERIIESMRKNRPECSYSKHHLKTAERIAMTTEYIERQSTILRRV